MTNRSIQLYEPKNEENIKKRNSLTKIIEDIDEQIVNNLSQKVLY